MQCELKVKVVPGASRNEIAGWLGDELKVRVSAPPEKGKANAAVCALLADKLGLPLSSVTVIKGQGNPRKRLQLEGLDATELRERLAKIVS